MASAVLEKSAVREDWLAALNALTADVTVWAEAEGWEVRREAHTVNEEFVGEYEATDLKITTPDGGQVRLEVRGRGAADGSGFAQLMAWPTLYRVQLRHRPGQDGWTIRTDSGISLRQPWGRETFVTLVRDLLSAERDG
jgi:hypothetical protein